MELIILGAGAGMPEPGKHLSSILIRRAEQLIMADCGDSCAHRLLEHNIAAEELDAIFITHYHPDHIGGLFMVLQMLYLQNRKRDLLLFLPERPASFLEILQLMYTFPQKFGFNLLIRDMEQAELYFDWISAVPNDHLLRYANIISEHNLPNQMQSWSLCFTGINGNFVYTSDIETTDCIMEILKEAHTVLVDAGHPEPEQILKLQYTALKRIILTHGLSPKLEEKKDLLNPEIFEFAKEDVVYQI
ncbi:MAG TPA: MBL fold metallo-hydrolase [Candidatus Cloacimonas sp.]|jgi:glyoxylase-like metal-dependent hydrolase (beta-lactamase superfamily II)|nr:MBL fold metallo-hydrolase [Candidatus Cloacimonas sp.]HRR51780.1 MBL fold metallo-hydrolase [Candidatus Cloacimonas sp.]